MFEGAADTDPLAGRSAGRIEDELWLPFLDNTKAEGLSNTHAMRRMIRIAWAGMREPAALTDAGSGGDRLSAS